MLPTSKEKFALNAVGEVSETRSRKNNRTDLFSNIQFWCGFRGAISVPDADVGSAAGAAGTARDRRPHSLRADRRADGGADTINLIAAVA